MKNAALLLAVPAVCLALSAVAAETPTPQKVVTSVQPAGTIDVSLRNEVEAAIDRGLAWLAAHQQKDGAWSDTQFPALTALPLQAFALRANPRHKDVSARACAFIMTCVQEDGGIYRTVPGRKGGGLSNYNTAICMTALHATGNPDYTRTVQAAREFIAGAQHFGDDSYAGGFGYDRSTGRAYADLLNTFYAARAMRETQDVEDKRPAGEKRVDINWAETVKFIEQMQNKPGADKDDSGGFFYKPGESKAGTTTNEAGVVVFRSYASITYAGLLALVYANVSREDTRVVSAMDWAARHWSLEENPGMGAQGLYFFYNVLSKSLAASGRDLVPRPGADPVNWRMALADKLVKMQKIEADTGQGYWTNENGRFWEQNPVLCTAYAILALQYM